jgi:hypothetical protein
MLGQRMKTRRLGEHVVYGGLRDAVVFEEIETHLGAGREQLASDGVNRAGFAGETGTEVYDRDLVRGKLQRRWRGGGDVAYVVYALLTHVLSGRV